MSWFPRLKGNVLGKAMGKFKKTFDTDYDYNSFIINSNIDNIRDTFMKVYNGKK